MTANVAARPAAPQRQASTPQARTSPAPIQIPTRNRASSTSSSIQSSHKGSSTLAAFVDSRLLGSAATTTPFSLLEEEEEREARAALSPPPRPSSSPPLPGRARSVSSPNSPPSPTQARVAATNGTNTPSTGTPKRITGKGGWHTKIFNFDSVLGALDPNRVASSTAPNPIPIAVFGSETEEGMAVCRELLAAKCWALVALTVDDTTPEADELREAGVKVVQVDMDDPYTYRRELLHMKAIYLATNVLCLHAILKHQPEPLRTQIARQADACQLSKALNACQQAKVGHVVFRVTACGEEVVEGVLGRPKRVIEAQQELVKRNIAHTVLHTTMPYGRVREWLVRRGDTWLLNCPIPDNIKIPMYALEQTGLYVIATLKSHQQKIVKHQHYTPGEEIHAIGEWLTPTEIAQKLSKIAKLPVVTPKVTLEEFASLEFHERLSVRWDAWNQLITGEYQNEFDAYGKHARSPPCVEAWTFEQWLGRDREIQKLLSQT